MKATIILLGVALAGAVVVHMVFSLSLGVSLLIFFVGWPVLGTVLTLDDDLKGGWSNPDGDARPPWLQSPYWGQIIFGLAVAAIGFGIESGWRSAVGVQYFLLALAGGFIAGALITRRWWLSLGGLVSAAVWGVVRSSA